MAKTFVNEHTQTKSSKSRIVRSIFISIHLFALFCLICSFDRSIHSFIQILVIRLFVCVLCDCCVLLIFIFLQKLTPAKSIIYDSFSSLNSVNYTLCNLIALIKPHFIIPISIPFHSKCLCVSASKLCHCCVF